MKHMAFTVVLITAFVKICQKNCIIFYILFHIRMSNDKK